MSQGFLVGIFDNILDAEFEYDLRIMKEKFMKVMQKLSEWNQKCTCLVNMYQNVCNIEEFYLALLLHSPHALFDIFEKEFKVNG